MHTRNSCYLRKLSSFVLILFLLQVVQTGYLGYPPDTPRATVLPLWLISSALAEEPSVYQTLTVRGTRSAAENAFRINMSDYRVGEQVFYANDKEPALPKNIAASVQAVDGLSSLGKPKRLIEFLALSSCFVQAVLIVAVVDSTAHLTGSVWLSWTGSDC